MDSAKHSALNSSKSRLARTFTKVLHIRAVTGKASDDASMTKKSRERIDEDPVKNDQIRSLTIENEELRKRAIKEAFLAKLFAGLSSVKAAYAQLQLAQSPYDADGIESADKRIVSELRNLSGLKLSYLKEQLNETSPETTLALSEIRELKSLLRIYEITCRKLDSQLKLKESEVTVLKEKLVEANKVNRSLERELPVPENTRFSSLIPSHFVMFYRQAMKSIRSFARLLISEMESAEWDLDAAANAIETGVSFKKPNHKYFVFESFISREMFDGFNDRNFTVHPETSSSSSSSSSSEHTNSNNLYFDRFMEMQSAKPADYLALKPKSLFAAFCRAKYLKLVHPKMEASLFGSLDQRKMVNSGEIPETRFFSSFSEMARRVWLLHCMALALDPEVSIFQARKGSRFSEVYMESLNEEDLVRSDGTKETWSRVGFTRFPGFRFNKTIVRCHVYLSRT